MANKPIEMDDNERQRVADYFTPKGFWDASLDRLPWKGEGRGDMENCTMSLVYAKVIENTDDAPEVADAYAAQFTDGGKVSCMTECPLAANGKCLNVGA